MNVAARAMGHWASSSEWRGVPLTNEEAERAGITREGKLGSIGYRIGRRAGESVMDALRNGRIDDRAALWIADFCPGNDAVQRRGLEAALRDASKAEVLARGRRCASGCHGKQG